MDEETRWYKEGFHDGCTEIIQDLIKHGEKPIKLLERLDYWAGKLEKSQPKEENKGNI